jgi:exonuclease SbcD
VAADPVADPIVELRRLVESEVVRSEAYHAEIAEIANELRTQLPPECRLVLGADEDGFKAVLAELVNEGAEDVLARLQAGSDSGEA